ncbi:MAG: hypothetical protein RBU27_06455 [Bacteroidota bacterium]|jgi:hypothetical protein|nr:hypothetical protein [Bacteroidota bacterium]
MASYGTYFLKALKNPVALVIVGGLAAISLVSMNPLPVIIAFVGEALFVGGAPLLPAWRRRVDGHEAAQALEAAEDQARARLDALPATEQQRYRRLEHTAAGIRENYAQYSQASRDFLTQASTRIDDMLDRYLRMLLAKDSYAKHLASHSADELATRVAALEAEMAQADDRLREVKGRQREVLAQRLERLRKAEADSALLEAQLSTLEEMVMLMKEQAITMKEPEEISAQLDSLMGEIENTESTVSAIETSVEVAFDKELRKLESAS